MPFDLEGARQSGYSDAEIAAYLAERQRFNLEGARAAGYQDAEIIERLVAAGYEQPTPAARTPVAGWARSLRDAVAGDDELEAEIPRAPLTDQLFAGFDEYRANRGLDRALGQLETRQTVADIGRGRTLGVREGIERMRQAAGRPGELADVPTAATDPAIAERQALIGGDLANRFRSEVLEQAQLRQRAATVPFSPEVERLTEAETFGEGMRAFVDAPIRSVAELGIRSAPNMLEMIPGAIAGGMLAGPLGAMAGAGVGSFNVEERAAIAEGLQQAGIDLADPTSIEAAFADPELLREVERYAATRGVIISLVDAATMGVAGRTLAPSAFRPMARELTNLVAQTGVQAGGGALGETLAQLATTGELAPGEILAEAIGEAVTAPIDVGAAVAAGLRPQTPEPSVPVPPGRTLPAPDMIVDTEGVARTRSRFEEEQRRQREEADILGRQPAAGRQHPGAPNLVRPGEQIAPTEELGPSGLPPPAVYVDQQGVARSTEQLEAAIRLTDALFGREWAQAVDMGFTPDVAAAAERHPGRAGPAPAADPAALPPPDERLFVDPAGQAQSIDQLEQGQRDRAAADQAQRALAAELGLTDDVAAAGRQHPGQARPGAGRRLEPPDRTLYGGPEEPPATSADLEARDRARQEQDRARAALAAQLGLTPDVERAGQRHPGRAASAAAEILNTAPEASESPQEARSPEALPDAAGTGISQTAPGEAQAQPVAVPTKGKGRKGADPSRHSALEFIAHTKGTRATTGGINLDEAIAQGFDPADLKAMRVGIRRAFTKGGMSFDAAAELLAEAGYPVIDQNGRYDANMVVDIIDREIRGERVLSRQNQADFERMETERGLGEQLVGGDRRQEQSWTPPEDERRSGAERRHDPEARKRVGDMSLDELRQALLTSHVTGLPNRRAYNEAPKLAAQASIDVDSLKWINDNMGHESGDVLLQLVGQALQEELGDQAFHVSGDEFIAQGVDEWDLQAALERAQQRLAESYLEIELPNGDTLRVTGLGISFGIGGDLSAAETDLQAAKQARERSGARAGRGEQPPGATRIPPAGREDRGRATRAAQQQAPALEPGERRGRREEQEDIFGDDVRAEQELADEQRRRDERRSPNRDVPLETGDPSDLFSQARNQTDLVDQARQAERRDEDLDAELEARGEPIKSRQDAERRFSDGDRIFAFHEQDETPSEVTSLEMLRNYAPDQLLALPADETTQQRDDDAPRLEVTISTSFASGMNRSRDLAGAIKAGVPFGVDIGLISAEQIAELAEAAADGVSVFVDSGAFRLFKASQRDRARSGQVEVFGERIQSIDAKEVMRRYIELSEEAEVLGADPTALTFVMPDVVGRGRETLKLLRDHADTVRAFLDFGHEVVIPVQHAPDLSATEFADEVRELFKDSPSWRWGIPSNAEAMSDQALTEFVRSVEPGRLHVLGAVQQSALKPRLDAIEAGYSGDYEIDVSADGNVLRSSLDELTGKTGQARSDALAQILSEKLGGQQGITRRELGAEDTGSGRGGFNVGDRVRKRNGEVGTIRNFQRVGKKDRALVRFDRGKDGKPYEQLVDVDKLEREDSGPDDPDDGAGPPRVGEQQRRFGRRRRVQGQEAFHGGPFVFDKFSLEHIGKGEGNQSYGWGLYFTSKRAVAEWYRRTLAKLHQSFEEERKALERAYDALDRLHATMVDETIRRHGIPQSAIDQASQYPEGWGMQAEPRTYVVPTDEVVAKYKAEWERLKAIAEEASKELDAVMTGQKIKQTGKVYRVDLPTDNELMNWDVALEDQPKAVRDAAHAAAREAGIRHPRDWWTGEVLYSRLVTAHQTSAFRAQNPQRLASVLLRKHGIKGHQYEGDASQVKNFVIYDDEAVRMLDEAPFLDELGPDVIGEPRTPLRVIEGGRKDDDGGKTEPGVVWAIYSARAVKRRDGAIDIVRTPVTGAGTFPSRDEAIEHWRKELGNVPGGVLVRTNAETWEADVVRARDAFVERAALEDQLDEVLALISTADDSPLTRRLAQRFMRAYEAAEDTGEILEGDVALVRAFLDDDQVGERRRRPAKNDKQLELYLEQPPVKSQQNAPRLAQAKKDAAKAIEQLSDPRSQLGRRFSREMARRQSTSLVGQRLAGGIDLAVAAQIYRDPRFETLRMFFVDDDGKVVAQIGLTSRLPASSSVFVGSRMENARTYFRDVAERAKREGATGFYLLHNHPSGDSSPSTADQRFTESVSNTMDAEGLTFHEHVIIDHNNYSVIEPGGRTRKVDMPELKGEDFRPTDPRGGWKITSIEKFVDQVRERFVRHDDKATLFLTNPRLEIVSVTEISPDQLTGDAKRDRRTLARVLLAEPGAEFVFAATANKRIASRLEPHVMDIAIIDGNGYVYSNLRQNRSARTLGGFVSPNRVLPDWRPAQLSPDTSEAFDYLRTLVKRTRVADRELRASMGELMEPGAEVTVTEGKDDDVERQAGSAYVPLFQGGKAAPRKGKPFTLRKGQTQVDPSGEPIRREHIMALIQREFGMKVYQGKPFSAGRTTLGFFRPSNFEVRIKHKNDLEVTAHEFFHWLDRTYPTIRALYHQQRFSKQLKSISYDEKKIFEGFAEFGRLFMTQESEVIERAPEFYEAFVAEARALGILEKLEKVQRRMHAWYNQGAEARAKSKIGEKKAPIGERLTAAADGWLDQAIASALDRFHAAKVIERETTGNVAADATQSAYKGFRLLGGARSTINSFLNFGTLKWDTNGDLVFNGKGLKQVFEPVSDVLDETLAYFVGRRAQELMRHSKENLFTKDEIEALLDKGRNSEKFEEIKTAFQEYQRYTRRLTAFAVQSGILSPETKALWEALYQNYVPFYRVADRLGGIDQRMTGSASIFKRLKGGSANIRDVWENMTLNTALIVHASLKNMAKRQLFRTLERSPIGQRYAVKIPAHTEARKVAMEQVERVLLELARNAREQHAQASASGQPAAAAELAEIEMLAKALGGRIPELGQMPISDVQDQATFFFSGQPPRIPDKDSVMVRGKRVWYQIGDPLLWDMLTEVNYHKPIGLTERVFGIAKRTLTRGVTITPDFQVANMVRDTLNAATMSKGGQLPFVDAMRALRDIWTESEDFRLFLANGGGFGNAVGDEAKRVRLRLRGSGVKLRGIIDTPAALLDVWDKWGQSFELATRLAEFKRVRARGGSAREAAFQGREISSDFAMHGNSALARWAMISVAFFNARLQGLYRIERELFERKGRQSFMGERMLAYGARAFLGLTMPSVLIYLLLNRGDDDYEALPEEIKSLYTVIPAPNGGVYLIPRPFETGALFQEVPIRVLERMLGGEDEKLVDAFRFMIAETFAFSPVPTLAQPPLEILMNRQWNGLPVVPRNLEQVEPREQYRAWTPETYKRIGEQFNVSPVKLQTLVEGYFGTMGTYLATASDALIGASEDTGEPPRRGLSSYPVLRRFVREQPYRSTSYEQDFYELLDEVAITANSLRKMIREGREREAVEYISPPERALIFGLEGVTRRVADRASDINAQIRLITTNREMTGDLKREQIDALQREQNELFRTALEATSEEGLERLIRQMEGAEP